MAGRRRAVGLRLSAAALVVPALGLAALPPAFAHAAPATPWPALNALDVLPAALLAASLVLQCAGTLRLWRHAGAGHGARPGRTLAFAAGWSVLAAALLGPLDERAAHSFAWHMVQHELLMVVAAPLLVLARPLPVWLWALPAAARRRIGAGLRGPWIARPWQLLSAPLAAWVLHAAVLWGWHARAPFEAALRDAGWHAWQHTAFIASALLFWWSVLAARPRGALAPALLALFTTMLHTGALGALLSFATAPWYPAYGSDALADQQLGGLIMWVPGGAAYLWAALVLGARALRDETAGARIDMLPPCPAVPSTARPAR